MRLFPPTWIIGLCLALAPGPALADGEFDGALVTISGTVTMDVYFRKGSIHLTQTGAFDPFTDNHIYNAVRIDPAGGKECRKYNDDGRPGKHCYEVEKAGDGRWRIASTLNTAAGGGFEADSRTFVLTIAVEEEDCKARLLSYRRDYYGTSTSEDEAIDCFGGATPPSSGIVETLDRRFLR